MIEYLNDIDADALLAVNGLHDMFQDAFWWLLTAKWSSLLLVLALVWILLHQNRRHALLVVAMLTATSVAALETVNCVVVMATVPTVRTVTESV